MKQCLVIDQDLFITKDGVRLASYGRWRLPIISRSSDRLMQKDHHLIPVYPYIGLSKNDKDLFQVPTRMYIRSIIVSTMTVTSENVGIAGM